MLRSNCKTLGVIAVAALMVAGCGGSDADEPPASATDAVAPATDVVGTDVMATDAATPEATDPEVTAADPGGSPVTELADGPVTLITLGDSLTYGEGDQLGLGFVGRLAESIGKVPGREDVSLVNLGLSGWDSTMMADGGEGQPAQLGAAVEAVQAALAEGRAPLATVLIGSNDMWYLYAYGPPEGTPPENEQAAEDMYRTNLERTVSELTQAGAVVVLGLPDDQSIRPAVVDIDRLHNFLPDVTVEEVQQMSVFVNRLISVTEEIAAQYGLRTVDTNGPFWGEAATMADDGVHPNDDGYAILADLWFPVIQELL